MSEVTPKIICCGEALIDMLPALDTDGNVCCRPVPGGAVFNTAIALGRLGAPVGFLSGLSDDLFGATLTEALAESGVDSSFCPRNHSPTTLAFVKLVDGQAQYAFYDENTAGRLFSLDEIPDLPGVVAALHFGAISLAAEPCGTAFESLALREAPKRVISLDPNIRQGFIEDADQHKSRIKLLIDYCDILKVSDEDLAWLEPEINGREAVDDWISSTFDRGVSLIALTRGGGNTLIATATHAVEQTPAPRQVVDTVGAGDTFNAGLLSALHEMDSLQKSRLSALSKSQLTTVLSRAMTVAGAVVERAGANPPWRHELSAEQLSIEHSEQ